MMCENIVHPNRPQMMRMRIAFWITKAIDTPSVHVVVTVFPRQQWLRERTLMLRVYVSTLPLLFHIF